MKHLHLERCDSTQDVLKEQLSLAIDQDFLVSCDLQTSGRGRGNNKWQDSSGTICFSMTIMPHIRPSFTALELTLLVAKFFENTGHTTFIKWPNDLLTRNGLKCGGILIQSTGNRYMAGIGINLYSPLDEFGGIHVGSFHFDKSKWSLEIASFIHDHRFESTDQLTKEWEKRCYHLKKLVRITDDKYSYEGSFLGIGEDGEALLEIKGEIKRIYNGSLTLL